MASILDHLVHRQDDSPISQSPSNPADQFLKLIQNPFKSDFQVNAVWASLGTSIAVSAALAIIFSLFRPRHTVVYAPKLKLADQKHAPPPIGKGLFAWVSPVAHMKEEEMVDRMGLDATVFLRFTRMCRDIFIVLAVIGCAVLIPVNITQSRSSLTAGYSAFTTMTPLYISLDAVWAQVVCAWAFDIIVAVFLWWNYRAVLHLRRRYFQSADYQRSLHARTLIITDIPPSYRSDEGLLRLTEEVNPTSALPRTTIGRNVKDLPILVKKHEQAVRSLESVLSKYLKNPDQLPANRPTIRPPQEHRADYKEQGMGSRVDAIEYWTDRIQNLEAQIKDIRQSVDKRNAMPYGFASWDSIGHAHAVAYTARNKHPQGTTIRLAPRPNDLIWENLLLPPSTRRWKKLVAVFWVSLLTVVWIAPNAMIAIFLSNLSNLGLVWSAFQQSLNQNSRWWAAFQGIASPAVTSLIYLILPIIFRRILGGAGLATKTSRERHVVHFLYVFFILNNLIVFSLFSAVWTFVSAVVNAKNTDESTWQAIQDGHFYQQVMSALCDVSPFWVTWLLQRNLGAAIDLAQLVQLSWVSFSKTFLAPTPRQRIEWTAPQPFDYASYYNYFLFYATVALCFATVQPIVLPVTALYFGLDVWMKKYLLMYVFVTKTESGGRFWRLLYNRIVFAAILANVMVGLVVAAQGSWTMVFCVIPAPFAMLGFKLYCAKAFDRDMHFYNRANLNDVEALGGTSSGAMSKRATERLFSRFGHPALYRSLPTPMVHARAADSLRKVYRGRLGASEIRGEYSDIAMQSMSASQPGKSSVVGGAPFEVVSENEMDFSYFKDRPDFRDELGGGIYGRPDDLISERSHTPRQFTMDDSPGSSRASSPSGSFPGRKPVETADVTVYGAPSPGYRPLDGRRPSDADHPAFRPPMMGRPSSGKLQRYRSNESERELLQHAQPPPASLIAGGGVRRDSSGMNRPSQSAGAGPESGTEFVTLDRWRSGGYGPLSQDDTPESSYDYFRGQR